MDGGVCEVNKGANGEGDRMTGRLLPLEAEGYVSAFCSNPVPMAVIDRDCRVLESNEAARRVLLADGRVQCSTGAEDSAGGEHLREHLLRSAWIGDEGDTIRFKIERMPLIWNGNEATLLIFHDQTELWDLRRSLKQQDATLTSFSAYNEYGIKLGLRDYYYTLPKKELSIQEVFIHSLDSAEDYRQRLFCVLFYLKNRDELKGARHPMMKSIWAVLRGEQIKGYPTKDDIEEQAELYGINDIEP